MINRILNGNYFIISFILISVLTIIGVFYITDKLKQEEVRKVELYAISQKILLLQEFEVNKVQDFLFKIAETNTTIPVVLTDENDIPLLWKNYENNIFTNPKRSVEKIKELKNKYPPIVIDILGKKQFIYYEESLVLKQLQYFSLLIILLYIILLFFLILHMKKIGESSKNSLWTGMAKETAHQLGTPLTSIAGWLELLKDEFGDKEKSYINEIEKDLIRLSKISYRFSKIGSEPELRKINLISLLENICEYIRNRISTKINFKLIYDTQNITTLIDEDLFSWVVENLVNNALDAMNNSGEIIIKVIEEEKLIKILIKDTGKGLRQSKFKEIFNPGYTTKKRGWGLGLSLVKKIIEDYHKGKIYVRESELNKGTVFVIELQKIQSS